MARRSNKNKKIRLAAIAAALSTGGIVIALMPSANADQKALQPSAETALAATPKCGLPSENKCLAIDNYLYETKLPDGEISPAMKSLKVIEHISEGSSRDNPRVTKCLNVPTDKRIYLSNASDFLRQVSPGDTVFIQTWGQSDCGIDETTFADYQTAEMVVPNDGLRYFWIALRR